MKNILLPRTYIIRSSYLTHWSYRATWYAICIGGIANLSMLFFWNNARETRKLAEEIAASRENSEITLEAMRERTGGAVKQYQDLENWARHRRLSVTPILDAMERNITSFFGVVSFSWELRSITDNDRSGALSFVLAVQPEGVAEVNDPDGWVLGMRKILEDRGYLVGDVNISIKEEPKKPEPAVGEENDKNSGSAGDEGAERETGEENGVSRKTETGNKDEGNRDESKSDTAGGSENNDGEGDEPLETDISSMFKDGENGDGWMEGGDPRTGEAKNNQEDAMAGDSDGADGEPSAEDDANDVGVDAEDAKPDGLTFYTVTMTLTKKQE